MHAASQSSAFSFAFSLALAAGVQTVSLAQRRLACFVRESRFWGSLFLAASLGTKLLQQNQNSTTPSSTATPKASSCIFCRAPATIPPATWGRSQPCGIPSCWTCSGRRNTPCWRAATSSRRTRAPSSSARSWRRKTACPWGTASPSPTRGWAQRIAALRRPAAAGGHRPGPGQRGPGHLGR